MSNEETAKTTPKSADESAGDQNSARRGFEVPECCRQMMVQMMGRSFPNSAERADGPPAGDASGCPGIFGRLMVRMMKACCGESTTKDSQSAQV